MPPELTEEDLGLLDEKELLLRLLSMGSSGPSAGAGIHPALFSFLFGGSGGGIFGSPTPTPTPPPPGASLFEHRTPFGDLTGIGEVPNPGPEVGGGLGGAGFNDAFPTNLGAPPAPPLDPSTPSFSLGSSPLPLLPTDVGGSQASSDPFPGAGGSTQLPPFDLEAALLQEILLRRLAPHFRAQPDSPMIREARAGGALSAPLFYRPQSRPVQARRIG